MRKANGTVISRRWLFHGGAGYEGDVIAVVCAIWRGEGQPRVAAAPDLAVFAAFTKADLFAPKRS